MFIVSYTVILEWIFFPRSVQLDYLFHLHVLNRRFAEHTGFVVQHPLTAPVLGLEGGTVPLEEPAAG